MIDETFAVRLPFPGGFPVYPCRYVLFGGVARKVAIRFFNAGDIGVTGVRFRLKERDADGNLLADRVTEREGLFAESGKEFAVADVPVHGDCAAVEIEVLAVFSDEYEYEFTKDGVNLKYGHVPAPVKTERTLSFAPQATYSASKRRKRYVWLAIAAVFGVAACVAAMAWWFDFFDKTEHISAAVAETQIVMETERSDLERL